MSTTSTIASYLYSSNSFSISFFFFSFSSFCCLKLLSLLLLFSFFPLSLALFHTFFSISSPSSFHFPSLLRLLLLTSSSSFLRVAPFHPTPPPLSLNSPLPPTFSYAPSFSSSSLSFAYPLHPLLSPPPIRLLSPSLPSAVLPRLNICIKIGFTAVAVVENDLMNRGARETFSCQK